MNRYIKSLHARSLDLILCPEMIILMEVDVVKQKATSIPAPYGAGLRRVNGRDDRVLKVQRIVIKWLSVSVPEEKKRECYSCTYS